MQHEGFAARAERRLAAAADRIEGEGLRLGMDGEASKTTARDRELRVAALLVRDEAKVASRTQEESSMDPPEKPGGRPTPPLEAQEA